VIPENDRAEHRKIVQQESAKNFQQAQPRPKNTKRQPARGLSAEQARLFSASVKKMVADTIEELEEQQRRIDALTAEQNASNTTGAHGVTLNTQEKIDAIFALLQGP
jgi:hypothetical protein